MLRKEMERDDMTFRTDRQGKQTTREWDLNDPDRLKHDAPARTCDDPSAAPVSGMQMFDGEDLGAGDRSKAQMAQNNDWWEQQLAEKEAIRVRRPLNPTNLRMLFKWSLTPCYSISLRLIALSKNSSLPTPPSFSQLHISFLRTYIPYSFAFLGAS
jgi:hypothetical protein